MREKTILDILMIITSIVQYPSRILFLVWDKRTHEAYWIKSVWLAIFSDKLFKILNKF